MTDNNILREINELHAFFQAWFRGELTNDDASFARFTNAMAPEFRQIDPAGQIRPLSELSAALRGAHGCHAASTPPCRIWIENAEIRWHEGPRFLASYDEWQETGGRITARRSTAAFRKNPDAPNGVVWTDLHETWVSRS